MKLFKDPLGKHVFLSIAPLVNMDRTEYKFQVLIESLSTSFQMPE